MIAQNTSWLTLTNILLGVAVVLCAVIAALGACYGVLSSLKKRKSYEAELDHDMDEMFPPHSPAETSPLHKLWHRLCRRLFHSP